MINGDLTQDQADKIITKRQELISQRQTLNLQNDNFGIKDSTTREEIKTQMQEHQTELKQWAEDNGISEDHLKFLGFGFIENAKHKFGGIRGALTSGVTPNTNN